MKSYNLGEFSFECTVDKLIEELIKLKEKYSEYDTLEFEPNYRWEGDNSWSLFGKRKETEKERVAREKAEQEALKLQKKYVIENAKKLGIKPEDLQ
jgi:hypothetical protein